MSQKLSASNAYLRDPETRKEGLWLSAKTSSAIEGIRRPFVMRDAKTGRFATITPKGKKKAGGAGKSVP